MAGVVGLLAIKVLSNAIRLVAAMVIHAALRFQRAETPEEIAARRREEDARMHVKREPPPPLATTPSTAHKIGVRRFRSGVAKAVALYAVLAAAVYVLIHDWRLAMVVPAISVAVVVTYAQLQPLRTAFDALVFAILHPPRSAL